MTYAVKFAPEAEAQLLSLYRYIASCGSPESARRYTEAIVAYCESLRIVPHRGTCRDDIRPGLRITNYRARAVIAFSVDDSTNTVHVLGIYYGGRDYETLLNEDLADRQARQTEGAADDNRERA